jgi:hypothetical protein
MPCNKTYMPSNSKKYRAKVQAEDMLQLINNQCLVYDNGKQEPWEICEQRTCVEAGLVLVQAQCCSLHLQQQLNMPWVELWDADGVVHRRGITMQMYDSCMHGGSS